MIMIPCRLLCAGDLVSVNGVCCKIIHKAQLVVVKEITTGNRMFLCGYDCVEPIPLSVGFFKRNGFEIVSEYGGEVFFLLYEGDGFCINACENLRSNNVEWCVLAYNDRHEVIRQSTINSVHQFQTFLQFANIKMEVRP